MRPVLPQQSSWWGCGSGPAYPKESEGTPNEAKSSGRGGGGGEEEGGERNWGGRDRGREEEGVERREEGRKGEEVGGRERGRERERRREGEREKERGREREGGREKEGGREREGGREGERERRSKFATLVKGHTSILTREIIVCHLCEVEGVPSVLLCLFKCHHLDVQCPGGLEGGRVSKLRFTMDIQEISLTKLPVAMASNRSLSP